MRLFVDLIILFLLVTNYECSWWFLSRLQVSSVDVHVLCDNIPGLAKRQRLICKKHPEMMVSVKEGVKLGIKECQHQFANQRWNCSTIAKDASIFGKVLLKVGSRESAFVYAISSAGVVHSVTRSCSRGELMECECDPTKTGVHTDQKGEFRWGGCSDYIKYGAKFARRFVDAGERDHRDGRTLMNLHNNGAGRKAVQEHTALKCKCHGVSGSCSVRTCWVVMVDFRVTGNYLKRKYDGSTQVMVNQAGTELTVAKQSYKIPTKADLVYLDSSPDYCNNNSEAGTLGTAGRQCNKNSLGTDGCDIMCCGRGYDTKRVKKEKQCLCKFKWCCHVKCMNCTEWTELYTCKDLR